WLWVPACAGTTANVRLKRCEKNGLDCFAGARNDGGEGCACPHGFWTRCPHTVLATCKSAAIMQARRARKLSAGAPHVCGCVERSPILPQSEEGQHGGNDDNQTDQIDDLVHVTLRSFAP